MLNYETLLSSYDDKLTLMQWLKKVEEALKDASAVSFKVNKRGDATLTFSVVFEDGSELETLPIILQQGESVQRAAIRNGHLILTLTNGDELDAGDLGAVSGFRINDSQHLIVAYQNGYTQDLGAIFTGNINVDGKISANGLECDEYLKPKTASEQINAMPDFLGIAKTIGTANADFTEGVTSGSGTIVFDFANARVSNGKLNIAIAGRLNTGTADLVIGSRTRLMNWAIALPNSILSKLVPIDGGLYNVILGGKTYFYIASGGDVPPTAAAFKDNALFYTFAKGDNNINFGTSLSNATFEGNKTFSFRIEVNFVL